MSHLFIFIFSYGSVFYYGWKLDSNHIAMSEGAPGNYHNGYDSDKYYANIFYYEFSLYSFHFPIVLF